MSIIAESWKLSESRSCPDRTGWCGRSLGGSRSLALLDPFDDFAHFRILWLQAPCRFEVSEAFLKLPLARQSDAQVQMAIRILRAKAHDFGELQFSVVELALNRQFEAKPFTSFPIGRAELNGLAQTFNGLS